MFISNSKDLTSEHAQSENEEVTKVPDHIYNKFCVR